MSTPLVVSPPPLTLHDPEQSTADQSSLYVPVQRRGGTSSPYPQTPAPAVLRIPTTTEYIALDAPFPRIYTAEHLLALSPARPNETATDLAVKELLFTNAHPLMLKITPAIGRPRGSSLRAARAQAPSDDAMEGSAPRAQLKAPTAISGRKRARGASLRQIKVPRGDVAASPRSAGPHYRGVPKSPTGQAEGNWRNPRGRAPASPSMRD